MSRIGATLGFAFSFGFLLISLQIVASGKQNSFEKF